MANTNTTNPKIGDIGTSIRIQIVQYNTETEELEPADISDADQLIIKMQKPDDTLLVKEATFVTDGTDGLIEYITQSGDLDIPGRWKVEAEITLDDFFWSTDIFRMKVLDSL